MVARLHSPLGQYPLGVYGNSDAGYKFDTEAVITLVRFSRPAITKDYYSEMEWAYPQEIRLLASPALARNDDGGQITFYPCPLYYPVDIPPSTSLNKPKILQLVKTFMVEDIKKNRRRNSWHFKQATFPPFISKVRYHDCGRGFPRERQERLFNAINPSDFLLIRGLSTWLRSAMLACHFQFIEEAITSLFISLEASYRMVLRRLKELGHLNPGAKEAAEFIGSVFV